MATFPALRMRGSVHYYANERCRMNHPDTYGKCDCGSLSAAEELAITKRELLALEGDWRELQEYRAAPVDPDDWCVDATVVSWEKGSLLLEKNGSRRRVRPFGGDC